MKPFILIASVLGVLCLLFGGAINREGALAQDHSSRVRVPKGVYLELTRDFYEALREETERNATVYSNDPSAARLKEIAVSARFMVQTNLEILKQQEEMIQLLRRLLERK
ncbi:MAG: hypothetical protein K9M82_07310 [Deltaproteobacteria bacterium]|nr:hypothetical protein [Deltaproteobacteria bacterium]